MKRVKIGVNVKEHREGWNMNQISIEEDDLIRLLHARAKTCFGQFSTLSGFCKTCKDWRECLRDSH